MSGTIEPPVQSIEQLLDFLIDWHDITEVEPVDLPFDLPRPLQQVYERFGKAASWDKGGFFPEGIFCGQDFLVAPTQMETKTFVPAHGLCAGERMLTFFQENQGCFFLHVPLDRGDDPLVFKTDYPQVGRWAKPESPQIVMPESPQSMEERLASVLATFSLRETVLGCDKQWFRNRSFEAGDYKPRLILLKSTLHYGNPAIPIEFYADENEQLLIMYFSRIDMIHIAVRRLEAEAVFNDFDELEECL